VHGRDDVEDDVEDEHDDAEAEHPAADHRRRLGLRLRAGEIALLLGLMCLVREEERNDGEDAASTEERRAAEDEGQRGVHVLAAALRTEAATAGGRTEATAAGRGLTEAAAAALGRTEAAASTGSTSLWAEAAATRRRASVPTALGVAPRVNGRIRAHRFLYHSYLPVAGASMACLSARPCRKLT